MEKPGLWTIDRVFSFIPYPFQRWVERIQGRIPVPPTTLTSTVKDERITGMDTILQLYPLPAREVPLNGAYLAHDLRQYAQQSGKPFVYANFVVSLDGRIAIPHPSGEGLTVPKAIANERDWRLFQELIAQADILISSGRYLRDWAEGRAQELLRVDDPRFADLRAWREQRGLPRYPDFAILSNSLDFPIPPALTSGGRKAIVFTSSSSSPERVREIEARLGRVLMAGAQRVEGTRLVQQLAELGYGTIYSSAGPQILHALASDGALNRLYLTHAHLLLGSKPFASILEGPLLEPPGGMKIHHAYLDGHALGGLGQMFTSYDRADEAAQ
jgi:riboflavin biosynthesis pyrimidine reductase